MSETECDELEALEEEETRQKRKILQDLNAHCDKVCQSHGVDLY